jgi:hypothetical protein
MKGNITLGDASAAAVAFVLFVIVVGIGASVLAGVQASQVASSVAYNVSGFGLQGLLNLGNQAGTIGTILGAAILIGIVVSAFYFNKSQ